MEINGERSIHGAKRDRPKMHQEEMKKRTVPKCIKKRWKKGLSQNASQKHAKKNRPQWHDSFFLNKNYA